MTREEAIERIRQRINGMSWCIDDEDKEALETLIPDLVESEDEKIREEIISALKFANDGGVYDKHIAYLEKQKEQNSSALQDAFDRSVKDYSLEEKCKASDYADSILPTSVTYGESDEEYKLHKIMEAAFIAGQKEQKPVEWSEEDEKKMFFLERLIEYNVPDGQYGWADGRKGGFVTKSEAISMLKSLRPSWKPSEEQMKALHAASSLSSLGEYVQRHLWSLYEIRTTQETDVKP